MNNESPLTKKDLLEALGNLEQRLEAKFEALMDTKLNALEERLREYVHDTETGLLKAFMNTQ